MLRLAIFTLAYLLVSETASAEETCIDLHLAAPEAGDQQNLSKLLDDVRSIADSFPFLQDAIQSERTELCFSDQMNNALGYLDVEQNKIVINQAVPHDLKIGILLHELRHLWQ